MGPTQPLVQGSFKQIVPDGHLKSNTRGRHFCLERPLFSKQFAQNPHYLMPFMTYFYRIEKSCLEHQQIDEANGQNQITALPLNSNQLYHKSRVFGTVEK
jgi:hypothetical protein